MIARTRSVLTVCTTTLMILALAGARGFCPTGEAPIASPFAVDTGVQPSSRDVIGWRAAARASTPRRDEGVRDAIDLYGNEVTAAVATYKLDGTGALYELHSPQTEVPQLPPPKS